MAVITILSIIWMVLSAPVAARSEGDGHNLHVNYYKNTCPQAENIINKAVTEAINSDLGVAAALVRMLFHDCFVNGCDASILLDENPSREPVEMTSRANIGVRGLEVIYEAKARLENECPETVSCADIVAFVSRDASVASGLNYYYVPAGRHDGLVSQAKDSIENLPKSSSNVSYMAKMFAQKGLSLHDMVTLLGAHSIGVAHCSTFDKRLYNFSQDQTMDPQLNQLFAFTLKLACPEVMKDRNPLVHLDHITPTTLDNFYYVRLLAGKGLLYSDQVLMEDPQTREIVEQMAFDTDMWNREFGKAMVRMGRIDVLTGQEGEIRRDCRFVNK
ncbi:peroxidase 5-like [Telopea speciosissima]|uniref:peroxidase 5-like n=1 Tax=Telopea speciosissima TaxID=54955 RepID=UPI001CC3F00C|nr:peroxidase 5-like [Telopea speciosissima]